MGYLKNKITNENYEKMWCRHALVAEETKRYSTRNITDPQITSVNRVGNRDHPKCLGKACPSLVFMKKEDNEWIGYCGADPNHRRI